MRWLVVGAGALGGYFGGRLLQAGEDVTFLLRPRRLAQIRATGLVIKSPRGDAHIPAPPCVMKEGLAGPYDMIVLGCKAYDLESAMDAFAPAVGATTGILPLLNGMGHLDRLSARFGAGCVLGGLCMISAALDRDGAIRHLNELHALTYGELDGVHSERVRAIEAAFAPANFDACASDAILQEMWEKWVFIAALAGSTCLMRAAIGDIVRAEGTDLMLGMLDECAAIAASSGFAPRPEARTRMQAFVTNAESTVSASMLKDIERHARIEGEHIVGELVARAVTPAPHLLRLALAHLRSYEVRREREIAGGFAAQ
ncbi:MAG: 2-dehydropantoate 2-reductase [Rhodanobacteraceae bacterium]|nr:MAG: 2-dehydropantoate 2-reductase [Rhodanobacteraceae bacterium]